MAGGCVLELESVGQLGTAQYTSYTMTKNFPLRPSPCVFCVVLVSTLYTLHITHYTLHSVSLSGSLLVCRCSQSRAQWQQTFSTL